ncbi:hypothetical protein H2200_000376 [Cladophialophora chaetospira]|uniref:Uncharacterized protein n=1 Tax=Cladophialophora chaetospira TaxID=386627 RepID=A0AA38XNF2_9EURO|nr:hypothetical protein H2200_000376 [Cladophialophora chaetospira]
MRKAVIEHTQGNKGSAAVNHLSDATSPDDELLRVLLTDLELGPMQATEDLEDTDADPKEIDAIDHLQNHLNGNLQLLGHECCRDSMIRNNITCSYDALAIIEHVAIQLELNGASIQKRNRQHFNIIFNFVRLARVEDPI